MNKELNIFLTTVQSVFKINLF